MTDSEKDTDPDDSTTNDLLERLVSLQEQVVEEVDETTKRLDDLEARIDKADDDGEDDDDEDDEDEEDDDKDTDSDGGDGKSVTIVAGADASEETVKRIKEMRAAANDDGELELDESKTTLFGESGDDEQGEKQTDDTTDNGGWL